MLPFLSELHHMPERVLIDPVLPTKSNEGCLLSGTPDLLTCMFLKVTRALRTK